jgi:hypothetical protein
MANLSSDAYIKISGEGKTETFFIDTAIAKTIYKGQPVVLFKSGGDVVNVVGWIGGGTYDLANNDIFLGIAAEQKSVLAAGPETTELAVYTAPTIVGFKDSAPVFTNADIGKAVCMSDSATLVGIAGVANCPQIGVVWRHEDGFTFVKLITPFITVNS